MVGKNDNDSKHISYRLSGHLAHSSSSYEEKNSK